MGKDLNGVRHYVTNEVCLSWHNSDQVKELVTGFSSIVKALNPRVLSVRITPRNAISNSFGCYMVFPSVYFGIIN